jgi:quercetin dioxygenase-like cupin family protein
MKLVAFSREFAEPISVFHSTGASSVQLGDGEGEAHVHWVHFDPGGRIGRHRAGFGQLFLVMEGSGWVEGGDGMRVELTAGQGAFIENGETHAKGSHAGMTALMVQVSELRPCPATVPGRTAPRPE